MKARADHDGWVGDPEDPMDCQACEDAGELCPWHLDNLRADALRALDVIEGQDHGSRLRPAEGWRVPA